MHPPSLRPARAGHQTQPDHGHVACADVWDRLNGLCIGSETPADHGPAEEALTAGEDDRVVNVFRRVSTSRLRTAAINVSVHRLRTGLCSIPDCTATGLRLAGRREVISAVLKVLRYSGEEAQMVGISIEHSLG